MLGAFAERQMKEMQTAKIQFKPDGTAFYSGDVSILGAEKGGDGKWEILRQEGDNLFVRLTMPQDTFEARLAFSGNECFMFTRPDARDQPPVLFSFTK
jgi:hypothetical protein